MQDSILSGNKHFQLHTWLQQAEDFGNTPAEKKLALKNGKMQITYWGPDNPSTDLHDYANKEWSGLMKYFYLPRWEMFVKDCMAILEGKPAPKSPDYFEFEKEWTGKPDLYPPMKITSSRQESIIRRILMMD